jgi:F-type H+-transporting ATPase subunit epsilon
MENKLLFELITPYRRVIKEEVDEVIAPGAEGEFGILPDHTPFLTMLKIGELAYRKGNKFYYVAVNQGFMEVRDNIVTALVETAEQPSEIDIERAERAKKRAEEKLKELSLEDKEYYTYLLALQRAILRIKTYQLK